MASVQFKCTVFFNQGSAGWSETYYNAQPDFPAVKAKLNLLIAARAALVAQPAYIASARISVEPNQRSTILYTPAGLTYFPATYEADAPWTAALIGCGTGGGPKRPIYMRGIPDALYDIEGAGTTVPQTLWINSLNGDFIPTLLAGGWQLKALNTDAGNGFGLHPIIFWSNTGSTAAFGLQAVDDPIWPVGTRVHVYNLKGMGPAPGVVKILLRLAGPPPTYTILYNGINAAAYGQGATARKVGYTYVNITSAAFERGVHRIVGRPFGLQRGRRPSRPRSVS